MGSRTLELVREELPRLPGTPQAEPGNSEGAFRALLRSIVELDFEPGQMVSERELMEHAGVSRPSLRQAAARLADLGLIQPLARKGLMISPIDLLDVSEVYDARITIEGVIAAFGANRATAKQIVELQTLAEGSKAREDDDAGIFVARDLGLHFALAKVCRNRYLEDALTRILPVSARLWHLLYRDLGSDHKFMFEHDEIIGAIARRDAEAATAATVAHLQAAREILANAFIPLPATSVS
jgi:DNA-binding GntR family transcriptional regulator